MLPIRKVSVLKSYTAFCTLKCIVIANCLMTRPLIYLLLEKKQISLIMRHSFVLCHTY